MKAKNDKSIHEIYIKKDKKKLRGRNLKNKKKIKKNLDVRKMRGSINLRKKIYGWIF